MSPSCRPLHRVPGLLKVVFLGVLATTIVTGAWATSSDDRLIDLPDTTAEAPPTADYPSTDYPSIEDYRFTAREQSTDKPQPTKESATTEESASSDEPPPSEKSEAGKKPAPVGEPLAPGMIRLLQKEIAAGLKRRGIEAQFARFGRYAGSRLNATAHPGAGSELTGKCRLKWYDHMLRNPLKAPAEAEQFTRELHQAVCGDHRGLARALAIAAEKLDLPSRKPRSFPAVTSPEQALKVIKQALSDAQVAYCAALAPLSKSEIRELTRGLYPVLTSQNRVGHTLQSRGTGRRLCDLMQKLDRNAMHTAAEALLPITDPELLEQLKSTPQGDEDNVTVPGATGPIIRRINTPSGAIVIGGKEQNTYQLDKMPGVNVVIDLGGNDVYHEGTVSLRRPVLVVIDLGGNDAYRATGPGVQGSAVLGISMLLDLAGDDTYQAKDVAQGSCLAGAGILIDYDGNDAYVGLRRVQGQAVGGLGILIDRGGNDRYHAAMWAQGLGGPLGLGLLDDLDGKDHYYGGGLYLNSYLDDDNPTPGYEGWAQGMGEGIRQVADGGLGVILDGGGDDIYEYDYLSHGGGYWCGTGFARDFGGNDQRLGATRKAYNGGPRTQRRFQRFGTGMGCHYALGFLFDDAGNDTYNGTIMGVGFSWDCAVGYLCDFGGNDRYKGNEGNGKQAGLGVLFDYDGDDVYLGYKQGRASSGISYHSMPQCGGNFSFLIDYGGTDKYGCGARNNSYNRRGSSGGFLIDRPKQDNTSSLAAGLARRVAERPMRSSANAPGKPGG